MLQFKMPDYGLKLIPVDFAQQLLPGTLEFALCHRGDNNLDLTALRARYANDAGGAPTFDPAVLLVYSRGLISSRSIAAACRSNVLFMSVSGQSARTSSRLRISSALWVTKPAGSSPRYC